MYHGVCIGGRSTGQAHRGRCTGLGSSTSPGHRGKGGKITPGKVGAAQIAEATVTETQVCGKDNSLFSLIYLRRGLL